MINQSTITAIILTYNEAQHIERCINSIKEIVNEIIVVDSFSTDNTLLLAESLGAKVYKNPFINQAVQFNWALKNCNIKSEWILRIDADEFIENKNDISLKKYLYNLNKNVNGILIKRKIIFLGKPLLNGGWYPKYNLRIFKNGYGECENRWMDEHIIINEGVIEKINIDFIDENLNNLKWWITKHNNYSTREAIDYFINNKENSVNPNFFGNEAEKKRWMKEKYQTIPLFIRPLLNFIYRYFLKLGFLDGKSGLVWHVLQGFWYRFLVDTKIFELQKKFNYNEKDIVSYIRDNYNIE